MFKAIHAARRAFTGRGSVRNLPRSGKGTIFRFPRAPGPNTLHGNTDFLRLWAAHSISQLGSHVTLLALPLTAAITLEATPGHMGLLTAAERVPFLVLGLFAGVWIDRRRHRALLIASDYSRAAVLAVVPIAAMTGSLSIELLIVVALLMGTLTMIFDISYVAFLPSVVRRDDLTGANSRLEASYAVAQASGPGLGGLLIGAVGAPITLLFDALSFLLSGVLLQTVRSSEAAADVRQRADPGSIGSDIRAGITVLLSHPLLRATAAAAVTTSLFGWAFLSVYLLFLTRELALGPGTIGVILTLGGLGSAAGAVLAGPLARRGVGRAMLWSQVVNTLGSLAVPLAIFVPHLALPMLAISEVVQWGALTLFGVLQLSLRQTIVPGTLRGRVTATHRVLVTGGAALGGLFGGWLGSSLGLGATLAVCALGMGFSVLWIAVSPVPMLSRMDDAID